MAFCIFIKEDEYNHILNHIYTNWSSYENDDENDDDQYQVCCFNYLFSSFVNKSNSLLNIWK